MTNFRPVAEMATHEIKEEMDRLQQYLDTCSDAKDPEFVRSYDRMRVLKWEFTERIDKLMGR
ncbi:hypothetical protein [Hyphomicrobium sp. ghe19]|uniref:hypothetical protein n=1 Tax=Hyphomicrobium sp. ghe19 TaxID=2682968 RepID=UPI00136748CB|nr:hypothetical protein HYPP_02423 [Hyphomicrobium sp. ghe19]